MKIPTSTQLMAFAAGFPLTDKDCLELFAFYSMMEEGLSILGPIFHLAWKDIKASKDRIEGYIKARKADGEFHP